MTPEVFTLNGILKGKNTTEASMPIGCSIQRVKQGVPTGDPHGYWKHEDKIEQKAIDALTDLNPGDEIQYSSKDFRVLDIWKKGSRNNTRFGSGGWYRPQDPTTELIKNFSILHESILDKSMQFEMFCLEHEVLFEERDRLWGDIVSRTITASNMIYDGIETRMRGGNK